MMQGTQSNAIKITCEDKYGTDQLAAEVKVEKLASGCQRRKD